MELCSSPASVDLACATGVCGGRCWSSAALTSGTLALVKKHLQSAGGGALFKWLKPPLWALCLSLKSTCADRRGKNGVSQLSCPQRGEFGLATIQEAFTEGTVPPHLSQASLRFLPSPCLGLSHLFTWQHSAPVFYLR